MSFHSSHRSRPVSEFAKLSAARREFIRLCQKLNFGQIRELTIVDGDPMLLDPPPRIIREVKFGGDNAPRPERDRHDFQLKSQVIELFALFDEIGDGWIDRLEIKHGLPFKVDVAESAS